MGCFTIENFRLMLRVRAPATSQLAKNLLLPLLLRHLLQAMRCFFCLMYWHILSLCFHIIESSVRCGYLPSQRCSQKCWLMDLQSSMILKMLESSIFLLTIFIYSILTIYSARLCSLNTHITSWPIRKTQFQQYRDTNWVRMKLWPTNWPTHRDRCWIWSSSCGCKDYPQQSTKNPSLIKQAKKISSRPIVSHVSCSARSSRHISKSLTLIFVFFFAPNSSSKRILKSNFPVPLNYPPQRLMDLKLLFTGTCDSIFNLGKVCNLIPHSSTTR